MIFLQHQKGKLSREEATDKIICCALKSRRQLFKQDDDDMQGAEGGEDICRATGMEEAPKAALDIQCLR